MRSLNYKGRLLSDHVFVCTETGEEFLVSDMQMAAGYDCGHRLPKPKLRTDPTYERPPGTPSRRRKKS